MTEPPELREPDLPRTAKVKQRALRTGWTTGTCSTAAAKAALTALLTGQPQTQVEVELPSGKLVSFAVASCSVQDNAATAIVVKDAGDDPDVTHGAELTVTVSRRDAPGIEFAAGVGVGTVTKPGLGLEVGGPAINPVPRRMMTTNLQSLLDLSAHGVRVEISVPDGQARARKTTNERLGIVGGISILGTTGIVRPFSTASWRASVVQAVSVAAAQGERTVVLATGGRTEKAAMRLHPELPEVCFIEVGDFTGAALRAAVEHGMTHVAFVGMAGKLTKLASGVLMTHWTKSKVDNDLLADITRVAGGDAGPMATANTARHAYEMWEAAGVLPAAGAELCRRVRDVLQRFSEGKLTADVAMVDFAGAEVIARSV
ncbi:MAG: cobalt-precorrin-5B (C1)-methyltransferase [Frankiaceae bacterium]|nr:cobalt-precorrin-5B (C1)-methyltransferase [Frankiaceae bacterium]